MEGSTEPIVSPSYIPFFNFGLAGVGIKACPYRCQDQRNIAETHLRDVGLKDLCQTTKALLGKREAAHVARSVLMTRPTPQAPRHSEASSAAVNHTLILI